MKSIILFYAKLVRHHTLSVKIKSGFLFITQIIYLTATVFCSYGLDSGTDLRTTNNLTTY